MLPQVNIVRAKNADFLCFWERAGISGVLTAHGVWDEPTIHFAKILIDRTPLTPVILDVGANMGTFSIPIARHVEKSNGIVHSFEPQRIIYYQLCGKIFLNRVDNIFAHKIALSDVDRDGSAKPLDYEKSWNIGAYSLSVDSKDPQEKGETAEIISFARLDQFKFDPAITLIKIDVEGMELEVLRGGLNSIEKSKFPPVLFEYNQGDPKGPFVLQLLTGFGYKIYKYSECDYLAQHPGHPAKLID